MPAIQPINVQGMLEISFMCPSAVVGSRILIGDSERRRAMGKLGLLASSILLGSIGQILLKEGANQLKEIKLSFSTITQVCVNVYSNIPILAGLVLYGISSFLWIQALAKAELSFAYPMVAFSYVIVSCAAWIIFKDHFSFQRVLSLGIIVIGVILLSRS